MIFIAWCGIIQISIMEINEIALENNTGSETETFVFNSSTENQIQIMPFSQQSTNTGKLLSNISAMACTLRDIKKVYSAIDIQNNDIFLTLADTGEVVSVNKVIREWRESNYNEKDSFRRC